VAKKRFVFKGCNIFFLYHTRAKGKKGSKKKDSTECKRNKEENTSPTTRELEIDCRPINSIKIREEI